MEKVKNIIKNPQMYQTIFLMVVINVGILFFGLYLDYVKFVIIFASTLLLDILFGYIRFGKPRFPFSGINAWFGISFFLRTDFLILYFFAALLAIGSKYLFQYKDGKHFLNPSNFWVFMILIFFPQISWTNPLQWTTHFSGWMPIIFIYSLILILGFVILGIVKKFLKINLWYIIIPFLLTHFTLYNIVAPTETFQTMWQWYTPSFFIFVFFMLTDPMIPPKSDIAKIWFGMNVAIFPYILQFFINENYTHLAALFIMTLFLPISNYITSKNQKSASENYLFFWFFSILVIILCCCIYRYGFVDLVFDNRCRQLICL